MNMATSTPPRRSLLRPRPSLSNTNSNTLITPSQSTKHPTTTTQRPAVQSQLSTSALQAASAAKSSLRSPASFDGTPRSALKPTAQGDASALLNLTSKRPVMAISTNHTVISGDDLDVGDTVDVPGGMHGTIKFIGEVRGKKGIFAGVELSREWAARGKNDGDVDG